MTQLFSGYETQAALEGAFEVAAAVPDYRI